MIRERHYQRRGRTESVREVTGLAALRFAAAERPRRLPDRSLLRHLPESALPQARALEGAGWVFVPASEAGRHPDARARAGVFLLPTGRLALGGNSLTVQFRGDPGEREARAVFDSLGWPGVSLDMLTFADGLYRAAVPTPDDRDAVDVANRLAGEEAVRFAEPEFIEAVGGR